MPKYIVKFQEIHYSYYEVDEVNPGKAMAKVIEECMDPFKVDFSHIVFGNTEVEEAKE